MATKTVPALQFTAAGAPQDFSYIAGVPGIFHPQLPMPVGDGADVPIEVARIFDGDPGCPVSLVQITQAQAQKYRTAADRHRKAGQ